MCLRLLCTYFLAVLFLAPLFLNPATGYAETVDVTAKVMAPLPLDLPIVLTPGNHTTQATDTVLITGKCPIVTPSLIVVLTRDDTSIGSGACDGLGIFRISVGLVLGINTIYSKFMTITGESSGVGEPFTITYAVNRATTPKKTQNSVGSTLPTPIRAAAGQGLKLVFDYDVVTVKTKESTNFKFTILGGTGPYKVTVDWGDSTFRDYLFDTPGVKDVMHTYDKIFNRPMHIAITLTDSLGGNVKQERAVVSFEKPTDFATDSHNRQVRVAAMWAGTAVVSLAAVAVAHHLVYLQGLSPHNIKPKLKLKARSKGKR